MAASELLKLIGDFKGRNVLVLGDIMIDQYTHGAVSRISPEAPVPVLKRDSEKFTLGGAANVANNLVALGASVILGGVVGDDARKDIVRDKSRSVGILTDAVVVDATRPTTMKHRIVAGANHQMVRIDDESEKTLGSDVEDAFLAKVLPIIPTQDAVVFSDYDKGFLTERVVKSVIVACQRSGVPIFADVKPKNLARFQGVSLIAPNAKEAEAMSGKSDIREMGETLVSMFSADVVITRGAEGISIFEKGGYEVTIPSRRIQVFDVSGAGDTVLAVIALARIAGGDLVQAATCANIAASIVVQKAGTAAVSIEELTAGLQSAPFAENASVLREASSKAE